MRVRKIHNRDWSFLPKWGALDRASLPQEGNGGFIVCSEPDNTPIAAVWIKIEEETAIPAVAASNPQYRDTNRSDALQLLEDFTMEIVSTMDYEIDNIKLRELCLGEQS